MTDATPKPEAPAGASTPQKRRRGRPLAAPAERRNVLVSVRLTRAEAAELQARADAQATAPATLMRDAALRRRLPPPPVPAVNLSQYAELARLASNLNQLARAANAGRAVVDAGLLAELAEEVRRLRLALLAVEPDESLP